MKLNQTTTILPLVREFPFLTEALAERSKDGKYMGCLEVGQDATHLRSL